MIVYHGSTKEIVVPDVSHSKANLDFGKGFYVTSIRSQAERWAARKAMRLGGEPVVNIYELGDLQDYNVKEFNDSDAEWLRFVVKCRNGGNEYEQYDVIMGKVADDDVFKCVNMFMDGYWDEDRTLEEIKYCKDNNQIVLVSQATIEKTLTFKGSYLVRENG